MNPQATVSTSVYLIPSFAVLVVAIVQMLREWKAVFVQKILTSTVGVRIVSIMAGGLLGLLYWFSASRPAWAFLCQLLNLQPIPVPFLVAVVQGMIAGALGTYGIALLHSFIDRGTVNKSGTGL